MSKRTCGTCRHGEFEKDKLGRNIHGYAGHCAFPLPVLPICYNAPQANSCIWTNDDAKDCACYAQRTERCAICRGFRLASDTCPTRWTLNGGRPAHKKCALNASADALASAGLQPTTNSKGTRDE